MNRVSNNLISINSAANIVNFVSYLNGFFEIWEGKVNK